MSQHTSYAAGIEASTSELIRARPPRTVTGFAPSGRVSTHQWGTNNSVFRGRGMEFAESREYQPGDDVKHVDWKVTARTGRAHTKLFQEERERPVHILLDLRNMMHFGSRIRFKSHLAAEIAAQLAWVGHDGGDRVGGLILTRRGVRDFRAARTRRGVLRFIDAISDETRLARENADELSLAQGIRRLRHECRPGALAFVISDFSDFDETCEQELRRLSKSPHVTNILITDPLDSELPPRGGRISDGHKALSLSGLKRTALHDYAEAFRQRRQRLEQSCRQRGMAFHALSTSDNATSILHIKGGRPPRRSQ
ncbi:MAG: DUF58 domain-containing protein [Alphaproteobacteria bacterium]|nr:DUF58 domain-containing protein [Alphaproteobacteria bacterium]